MDSNVNVKDIIFVPCTCSQVLWNIYVYYFCAVEYCESENTTPVLQKKEYSHFMPLKDQLVSAQIWIPVIMFQY